MGGKKTLETRREELKTLRDEMKVRLHLAEMEVKERWEKLEPEIDRTLDRLEEATERAMDVVIAKVKKFEDSLGHSRKKAS